MDEICKLLECEWETRLKHDVKHTQEQVCERQKTRIYREIRGCVESYDRNYNVINYVISIFIEYDAIGRWRVVYAIYRETSRIGAFYRNEPLDFILHTNFIGFNDEHEIAIQNEIMRYRKRYVDNVLLEICIVTFLELYANKHFHNLRNVERILADDFLVKMILSKI